MAIIYLVGMPNIFRFNPLIFWCACCSKQSTIIESQKRAHIIHCKHCLLKPFVCSECRWKKGRTNPIVTCLWCQTTGTLHSMHSFSCVEMNVRAADSLQFFREQHTNLAKLSHFNRSIFTNWRKFVELQQMVVCDFVTCSSYQETLRTNFFHTWLKFQFLQKIDIQNFSAFYLQIKISKRFLDTLKTITFSRKLISNLFGKPSESIISLRMSGLVFQHLLLNFAVLFKLQL